MPSLADSLKQFGYGEPLKQNFEEFARKRQLAKEQEAFNNVLSDAFSHIQNNIKQVPVSGQEHTLPQMQTQTALSALKPAPVTTDLAQLEPIGAQQQVVPPAKINMGTGTENIQMSSREIQRKNKEVIANMMMSTSQFTNLPPQQKAQAMQAIQAMVDATEPEIPTYKYQAEDLTKDLYRTNSLTGERELVRKGIPKVTPPRATKTLKSAGGYQMEQDPVTGNWKYSTDENGNPIKFYVKPKGGGGGGTSKAEKASEKVQTAQEKANVGVDEIVSKKEAFYSQPKDTKTGLRTFVIDGVIKNLSDKEFEQYKETWKNREKSKLAPTIVSTKIKPFINAIHVITKQGKDIDATVEYIINKNNLTEDQANTLRTYFNLSKL